MSHLIKSHDAVGRKIEVDLAQFCTEFADRRLGLSAAHENNHATVGIESEGNIHGRHGSRWPLAVLNDVGTDANNGQPWRFIDAGRKSQTQSFSERILGRPVLPSESLIHDHAFGT